MPSVKEMPMSAMPMPHATTDGHIAARIDRLPLTRDVAVLLALSWIVA
jgi:hypothetical protein